MCLQDQNGSLSFSPCGADDKKAFFARFPGASEARCFLGANAITLSHSISLVILKAGGFSYTSSNTANVIASWNQPGGGRLVGL